MNNKLRPLTKIITAVCAIALFASVFLPLWRIELAAPQYPEGLVLKIYPEKIAGDVDVINGLNHYIGMRTIHTADFFEFTILPWLIGLISFFGLLTFIINRKWFFLAWTFFFVLFGITAMFDFYRWEYNYGHNLDPAAAIRVPGMSYQPPLIGYKQLLNFGAYSIPDAGGWIFLSVGVLLVAAVYIELRKSVSITRKLEIKTVVAASLLSLTLFSCNTGPQPINIGTDGCSFCKMTISDPRFGGELITKKGKVYKFDDMHCLVTFYTSGLVEKEEINSIWLVDFDKKGGLISEKQAQLYRSADLHSPMGANVAAFSSPENLAKTSTMYQGEVISWQQLIK
jgi:copper chaperone NosL